MGVILSFQFSHTSLFIFFVPAFVFYAYSFRASIKPNQRSLFDFIVVVMSLSCLGVTLIKLFDGAGYFTRRHWELAILHLMPPTLALMAVWTSKDPVERLVQKIGGGFEKTPADGSADYKPEQPVQGKIRQMSWDDIIINEGVKKELNSVIKLLKDPDMASGYGIAVPKGILFQGPPGTGKTTIARVIATNAELSFFALRANDVVSKWVGESEKNLTKLFEAAEKAAPSVIFIDEIDSIGKKRADGNAAHSDNLLNHLLQLMDGVIETRGVYIIGATNRAELVDPALKRAGRLNRVIEIPLPDFDARIKLFNLYMKKINISDDVDIELLAKVTEGNSAADIEAIANQAGLHALQREADLPEKQRTMQVSIADVEAALNEYAVDEDAFDEDLEVKKKGSGPQPLNDQIEDIKWEDLIVSASLKEELMSVIELLKDPATAKEYGIDVPKGILLNGPPGTGKTTLAKVIAKTADLSFFVLQTNEIVSKWVGESEKNLSRLFKAAARHAPSVIFIDEVDSIGKNRAEGNAQHSDNLLNHMLQLIDGVIKRDGVYVIAATNRADLVDPALKRGGRLNKVIEVPLPDHEARKQLFDLYLSRLRLDGRVNLDALARFTEGKAAADIKEIVNQAGLNAYKRESRLGNKDFMVTANDIADAINEFMGLQQQTAG